MKPITNYKRQEQDYRKKMSACNVSYRLERSGPKLGFSNVEIGRPRAHQNDHGKTSTTHCYVEQCYEFWAMEVIPMS